MPSRREAYLLIAEDLSAQRLATAWPELPPIKSEPRLTVLWAQRAGVSVAEVYRCRPILFGNGICSDDGTTDDFVLSAIRTAMLSRLARGVRRPPREARRGRENAEG